MSNPSPPPHPSPPLPLYTTQDSPAPHRRPLRLPPPGRNLGRPAAAMDKLRALASAGYHAVPPPYDREVVIETEAPWKKRVRERKERLERNEIAV